MSTEDRPERKKGKFHGGPLVLEGMPEKFQERILNAAERTHKGDLQIMLYIEDDERVSLEDGDNIFITSDEEDPEEREYRESLHRAGNKTYHLIIVGTGDEEKAKEIFKEVGLHSGRAETITSKVAEDRKYPIRYKPAIK